MDRELFPHLCILNCLQLKIISMQSGIFWDDIFWSLLRPWSKSITEAGLAWVSPSSRSGTPWLPSSPVCLCSPRADLVFLLPCLQNLLQHQLAGVPHSPPGLGLAREEDKQCCSRSTWPALSLVPSSPSTTSWSRSLRGARASSAPLPYLLVDPTIGPAFLSPIRVLFPLTCLFVCLFSVTFCGWQVLLVFSIPEWNYLPS